jgi:hypothetical protein
MHITQEQIAGETRIDSTMSLVQDLKTNHGVEDPKLILVFESNGKVHVFFNSPTALEQANLEGPMLLRDTKVWVEGEEVIKTTYPDGTIGFCTKINGKPVWIKP